jgi:hypothetical protein
MVSMERKGLFPTLIVYGNSLVETESKQQDGFASSSWIIGGITPHSSSRVLASTARTLRSV